MNQYFSLVKTRLMFFVTRNKIGLNVEKLKTVFSVNWFCKKWEYGKILITNCKFVTKYVLLLTQYCDEKI